MAIYKIINNADRTRILINGDVNDDDIRLIYQAMSKKYSTSELILEKGHADTRWECMSSVDPAQEPLEFLPEEAEYV